MMLAGAVCACIAFVLISLNLVWYMLVPVFLLFGIGFYMLHNCIQVHVTDLTQTARGTALSLHSCSFYFGQAHRPDLLRLCLRAFRHGSTAACVARP